MKAKKKGFLRTFAAAVTAAAFLCLGCQAEAARTPRKRAQSHPARQTAPREDNRTAALVADARTGEVLYKEKAGEIRYPASLTKMMTLYLLFSELDKGKLRLDQTVTISDHAASQAPSVIGLKAGGEATIMDLALGMIVKSGNDAAVAAAEAIAGTEGRCAVRMNQAAASLGMRKTHFVNASGLHDPRQVTTAYELASLGIALKRDFPQYYHLFKRSEFTFNGRTFHSHNRVTENYPPADGLKTGFVNASGFNLVTSAEKNGRRLIGVVMGGSTGATRDRRMIALLEQGFSGSFDPSKGGRSGRSFASTDSDSKEKAADSPSVSNIAAQSAGLPPSQDSLSDDPLAKEGGFSTEGSSEAPEAKRKKGGTSAPSRNSKTKLHEIAEANEEQEAAFVGLLKKAEEEDAKKKENDERQTASSAKKQKPKSDVALAVTEDEGDGDGKSSGASSAKR